MGVMRDSIADASEQEAASRGEASGSHHEQVRMPVAEEGQNLLDRLTLQQLLRNRRDSRLPGRLGGPRQQFLVEPDILLSRLDELGPTLYGIDGMGRNDPDDRQRGGQASGQPDCLLEGVLGMARPVDGYGDGTDFGHQVWRRPASL